jgi:hypothetical protein
MKSAQPTSRVKPSLAFKLVSLKLLAQKLVAVKSVSEVPVLQR